MDAIETNGTARNHFKLSRVELNVVVCGEALVVLIAHPDAHHCTDGNGGSLDGEGVHVPLLVHWQGAVVQGKQPTNAHHQRVHLAHVRSPGIVVELQVHCSTRSLAEKLLISSTRCETVFIDGIAGEKLT
eukprot:Em0004g33a